MATALRPIAHEDRLSLVEHLDELRTRIIICLVAFIAVFALCFWQNDTILEIMDRPLEQSAISKGSDDPLERTASFQQAQKQLYLEWALLSREMARSDELSPALQARWAEMSRLSEATAEAAPAATGRRPVTLGVGEPFTATSGSSATRRCCCRCPCSCTRRTRSSCRPSHRASGRSRCR